MTAYALVTLYIDDPDTFARYRTMAGPAMKKHSATPLAVSTQPRIIEGDGETPDVSVILAFPDQEHALAWINDEAISEVHAARRASGRSQIILM